MNKKRKKLGDKVEEIIKAVVPDVILDNLPADCGCSERKELLNEFDDWLSEKI